MNNWFKVNVNEILCTGMSNSEIGIYIRYKALCEHFKVEELTWKQIKFNFDNKERKVVSKLFGILPEVEPKFDRSLTEVSPELVRSSTEVCPKCDSKNNDLDNPLYIDKTRQDKTKKDNINVIQKKSIFIKPSLEEIEEYCRERNNQVDAQKFYDFYTSNGWKVGKNPMKDWRAAVRTWERSDIAPVGSKAKKGMTDQEYESYWAELEKKWEAKHEQAC